MPNTLPTIVVRTLIQSSDWVVDEKNFGAPAEVEVGDVVKLRNIDAPAMLITEKTDLTVAICSWFTSFGEYRTLTINTESLVKLRQKG